MDRDFQKLEDAKITAEANELWLFQLWNKRKMQEAWNFNFIRRYDKCSNLIKVVRKRVFKYGHTSKVAYGNCTKLNKPITFIPNLCQLETQECFEHRRKDKFEHLNQ
jgi:hypothetical protein